MTRQSRLKQLSAFLKLQVLSFSTGNEGESIQKKKQWEWAKRKRDKFYPSSPTSVVLPKYSFFFRVEMYSGNHVIHDQFPIRSGGWESSSFRLGSSDNRFRAYPSLYREWPPLRSNHTTLFRALVLAVYTTLVQQDLGGRDEQKITKQKRWISQGDTYSDHFDTKEAEMKMCQCQKCSVNSVFNRPQAYPPPRRCIR